MTTEQKAKAYDEALKVLHKYDGANIMFTQDLKEEMFPELKESEDEKMRNEMISYFKQTNYDNAHTWNGINLNRFVAWLKKQGEHKPDDKIEPKFHEGDWVVSPNGVYWHIDKISNNRYEVTSNTGESSNWNLDTNIYHRFTIQDAKDGDVLLSPATPEGDKECPFIFKEIDKDGIVRFHAALLQSEKLKIADGITNVMGYANAGYHIPATKEQRDQLEKAMVNAGYKWNKKERKSEKIKQDPWSEEDDVAVKDICDKLNRLSRTYVGNESIVCQEEIKWLKSLSPQNKWKPSDKQMEVLWKYAEQNNYDGFILTSLHQQLKKLREQ